LNPACAVAGGRPSSATMMQDRHAPLLHPCAMVTPRSSKLSSKVAPGSTSQQRSPYVILGIVTHERRRSGLGSARRLAIEDVVAYALGRIGHDLDEFVAHAELFERIAQMLDHEVDVAVRDALGLQTGVRRTHVTTGIGIRSAGDH